MAEEERALEKGLAQLYESVGTRDLAEIVILAVVFYVLLRFLGKTRGSGLVRRGRPNGKPRVPPVTKPGCP